MSHTLDILPTRLGTTSTVQRGWLRRIDDEGTLYVSMYHAAGPICPCDVLLPAGGPAIVLNPGERVLFVPPDHDGERGCVLGTIGRYTVTSPAIDQPVSSTVASQPTGPHEQVLQLCADKRISLTCGEASITLTAEGAILIRGAKVVSRSKGLNRIKGASVLIN